MFSSPNGSRILAAGNRKSANGSGSTSMLMNSQPPQVSTLTWARSGALRRERTLPVVLLADVGARAVQTIGPAVEAADEGLPGLVAGVLGAGRHVDEPAAAVHADVVVGAKLVGARAHHDDRVVTDVVGQVAADVGDLLDAPDLLPHLAPQLVSLGPGVGLGDVGLDADRRRAREFFDDFAYDVVLGVGHQASSISARNASSFRNSDVWSGARWLHLRFMPPSTSSVWPVT